MAKKALIQNIPSTYFKNCMAADKIRDFAAIQYPAPMDAA